ncbi:hypothetical protein Nepgr_024866 [Nepenthes gracilis]|uniref:Uncharacterized protein n=1 Tax=Nepenthes gracilis TaxID=150966 RepID=A0AAD3XZ65_NEPGR|nr:hypothetical protein Nepgr_024866 [Nepenthes gracilis]
MIIPYFRCTDIKENQTNIPGFSLKLETAIVAPLRSPEKVDIRRARKKKSKKKASKARGLYEKNYSSTCEKLPQLLTRFSASIVGTGLTVIFSVICKMASGKAPLSTTKLVTTGWFGLGLFWLFWAINALREKVVYITKNSSAEGLNQGKGISYSCFHGC